MDLLKSQIIQSELLAKPASVEIKKRRESQEKL